MSGESGCIGVIAFGEPPREVVEYIASRIQVHFGIPAEILPPAPVPSYAFDARRIQYDVARIIENMETWENPGCRKVLGILAVDLFIPVFTHVFGEAREGGRCAAVSLFRLDKDPAEVMSPPAVLAERAAKVALHELGHLFDVAHCRDRSCLMHFSMDLNELDEMPMEFCRYCSAYLSDGLRS